MRASSSTDVDTNLHVTRIVVASTIEIATDIGGI
jgi:hypothetical protein